MANKIARLRKIRRNGPFDVEDTVKRVVTKSLLGHQYRFFRLGSCSS